MVGDIPGVVESVLERLVETERFKDFRIVGNEYGTTIVLRYNKLVMVGAPRHSPLWRHRSDVNLTRDNHRYNTWIKDQPMANHWGHNINSNNEMEGTTENLWSTNGFGSDIKAQVLNPEAPVFYGTPNVDNEVIPIKCEIAVQTEMVTEVKDSSAQTDVSARFVNSIGTQYYLEKRSIGLTCKIVPPTKAKYVQATTKTYNQESNACVNTKESGTNPEITGISVNKKDVGIECIQSPGALTRHVQTVNILSANASTNTAKTVQQSVGVGTEIEVRPSCRDLVAASFDTLGGSDVNTESSGVGETLEQPQSRRLTPDLDQPEVYGRLHGLTKLLHNLDVSLGGSDFNVESSGVGETLEQSQSRRVKPDLDQPEAYRSIGKSGLTKLLHNLDVSVARVGQHEEDFRNIWRNKHMKGLLLCNTEGVKGEIKQNNMYWAVFDDLGLQFSRKKDNFRLVQYVKLEGDCLRIMCMEDEHCEFSLIDDKDSRIYKQCEKIATCEIRPILAKIRSKHSRWKSTGAYGGGYGGDGGYAGYRVSGGYGGYGGTWKKYNK
jgi:hypothetical protein